MIPDQYKEQLKLNHTLIFEVYSFIVKYSNEKNLFISDNKLIYILERLDRSFDSVIKVINRLDTFSLELNEKVTYKNIKKILDNLN